VKSYFVWRRNDGYIGSTVFMPTGWIQPGDGKDVTFDLLGEFDDWDGARSCVLRNRASATLPDALRSHQGEGE
jgi:hypothetical protein